MFHIDSIWTAIPSAPLVHISVIASQECLRNVFKSLLTIEVLCFISLLLFYYVASSEFLEEYSNEYLKFPFLLKTWNWLPNNLETKSQSRSYMTSLEPVIPAYMTHSRCTCLFMYNKLCFNPGHSPLQRHSNNVVSPAPQHLAFLSFRYYSFDPIYWTKFGYDTGQNRRHWDGSLLGGEGSKRDLSSAC